MIALLIGIFAMAAVGLGWYGHKASVRIETWGRHANERDLIFQAMSEREDGRQSRTGGKWAIAEAAEASPFGSPHFHV
jgi:hypothetical protein